MKSLKRLCILSVAGAMALSACSSGASTSENGATAPAGAAETFAASPGEVESPADHRAGDAPADGAPPVPTPDAEYAAEEADGEIYAETAAMYEETAAVTTVAFAADMDTADEGEYTEEYFTSVTVNNGVRAGQLTAGEWNDNENWGFFVNLCNRGLIEYPAYGIDPRFRTAVTVKAPDGSPVVNASVTLFDGDKASWTAVTDKEGKVYLFGRGDTLRVSGGGTSSLYRIDGGVEDVPRETSEAETDIAAGTDITETERTTFHDALEIVVRKGTAELLGKDAADRIFGSEATETPPEDSPDMEAVAEQYIQDRQPFISNDVDVVFDGGYKAYPDMQIMFIVDTTGSMGDELMFLQSDFTAIAEAVGTDHAEFSVNFYKDKEDTYVTRTHPFSKDIKDISRILNSEYAEGGGDEPEAVSEILDECMHSQYWKGDTVKLAFLIFDAPPHSDSHSLKVLEKAMKSASAQGIRVIPVVSSNGARETELFGRGLAIFTGGTYVFLTDDSGIGESHLEPIIGHYEVESLYDLIIRLINEYRQ
ncbi:MAG: hypothetical protein J6I96_01600 [Oscillospiraceae bacterium]|nr:hypothetical protein [Oscillospiraceae bacterium]